MGYVAYFSNFGTPSISPEAAAVDGRYLCSSWVSCFCRIYLFYLYIY